MAHIDELLEGISGSLEFRVVAPEEIDEIERTEHLLIENGIDTNYRQLQLVAARKDKLLELYDSLVIGDYDKKTDKEVEQKLRGMCIPCFARIPEDQPEYIQLLYASIKPNRDYSISFEELVERASTISGEDAEIFYYELRRRFVLSLDYVMKDYDMVKREILPQRPWDDTQYDLYWEKTEFLRTAHRVLDQYRLMVHLIDRKENPDVSPNS